MALIKCQGSVYRGCANLLVRAAGRQVSPGAEVPYEDCRRVVTRSLALGGYRLVAGPYISYTKSVVVPAPSCLCFAPLSIVTAGNQQRHTRTRSISPPTQANKAEQATNGKPPTRPLHMHLNNTHIQHTTPCATKAPTTDTAAQHPPWARQGPAQRSHNRKRGAGATPRRPLGNPDTTASAHWDRTNKTIGT